MKQPFALVIFLSLLLPLFSIDFQESSSPHFQLLSTRDIPEAIELLYFLESIYQESGLLLSFEEKTSVIRIYDIEDTSQYRFWLQEKWGIEADDYLLIQSSLIRPSSLTLTGNWKTMENRSRIRYLLMNRLLAEQNLPYWVAAGLSAYFENPMNPVDPYNPWFPWLLENSSDRDWLDPQRLMELDPSHLEADPDLKGELWLLVTYMTATTRSDESRILWDTLSGTRSAESGLSETFKQNYRIYRRAILDSLPRPEQLKDLYSEGKFEELKLLSQNLLDSFPAQSLYYQGLAWYELGEFETSLLCFNEALNAGAPEEQVLASKAVLYWAMEEPDLCKEELMKLKFLNPKAIPENLRHLVD